MPIVGQFASLARAGSFLLPGGAFESIATVTVGSGGSSSITFSDIPATFQHLQMRGIFLSASGGSQLSVRLNGDTGANYAFHAVTGTGATATATGDGAQSYIFQNFNVATSGTYPYALVLDLLDYATASKNRVTRSFVGADMNGSGAVSLVSGMRVNTTAITSITIYDSGANLAQHSTASLYGIKAP